MKKHQKKQSKWPPIVLICIGSILCFIGVIMIFLAESGRISAEQGCDTKDYSGYVKQTKVETETWKNVKNQVTIYYNALQMAYADDDYDAAEELQKEYERMLAMQAQTEQYETQWDYSGVDEARKNCVSAATTQGEIQFKISIVVIISGVLVAGTGGVLLAMANRKKRVKKR